MTQNPSSQIIDKDEFYRHATYARIAPLMRASAVHALHGLPYPVQFRNTGALDGWRAEFEATAHGRALLKKWANPAFCRNYADDVIGELLVRAIATQNFDDMENRERRARTLADQIGVNFVFDLRGGAMIEATPALETLLTHSDVDTDLPMSMFVPPFPALYLHFGDECARTLKPANSEACPDRIIDGIFFFDMMHPPAAGSTQMVRQLGFFFVMKQGGEFTSFRDLIGVVRSPEISLSAWLTDLTYAFRDKSETEAQTQVSLQRTLDILGYVAKVFLYLTLKEARQIVVPEYSDAQRRLAGLGPKKQAKLARKAASLYDRIVVGPAALPDAHGASTNGQAVSPHWRRGHFRMQPHGPASALRKLIFVAPLLVGADRLADAPPPRPIVYRAKSWTPAPPAVRKN